MHIHSKYGRKVADALHPYCKSYRCFFPLDNTGSLFGALGGVIPEMPKASGIVTSAEAFNRISYKTFFDGHPDEPVCVVSRRCSPHGFGHARGVHIKREFSVSESRFLEFLPYLAATAVAALAVFPAAGLNRAVWRNLAPPGFWRILSAVAATVCVAAAMGFAYDRLDGVPRSLPVLQFLAGVAVLSGARVLQKFGQLAREEREDFGDPARAN